MKGVLLVNLGSPDSTSTKDVKKYLEEFLMDERVIDIPYWKRYLLIKGVILNVRPKKSAAAYKKIWWDEGSPLVVISERFTKKIALPICRAIELKTEDRKSDCVCFFFNVLFLVFFFVLINSK